MTDGLAQYHKIAREREGLTNANCFTHARRNFANAVKAIGKGNTDAIQSSVAYKALTRIGTIYKLEGGLKNLSSEERFKERQASIKPLVEEYFVWVKEILAQKTTLPKGETARTNNLNVYYYVKYLLTELPQLIDENGNIEQSLLESLMPWSKSLPADCYSKRRK